MEAERLETRLNLVFDSDHAGQIHGAAVDVNELLKEGHVGGQVAVDCSGDLLFRGRKLCLGECAWREEACVSNGQ